MFDRLYGQEKEIMLKTKYLPFSHHGATNFLSLFVFLLNNYNVGYLVTIIYL